MSVDDQLGTGAADLRADLLRRRLAGRATGRRTRIGQADRSRPLALSSGQQQMWFLQNLEPDSAEYVVPLVLSLRGELDAPRLRTAWQRIVDRHEVLRTRYELAGTAPHQVIDPAGPVELPLTDLGGQSDEDVRRTVEAELAQPFDLATRWPFRARLLRRSADEHVLVIAFHHIACDAWSIRLIAGELSRGYRGEAVEPLAVQYADFAAWETDRLTGDALRTQLDYWRSQLSGLEPLPLPLDRPRPAVRDWRGDLVPLTLSPELAGRARALATATGTTTYTVLLAAFQALLARLTGSTDIPVGVTVSGRGRPELQELVGYSINTLVVRAAWTGDLTFRGLLDHTRDTLLTAFDHQEVPFARLVDELAPERDLSRTPLYQVDFVLHEDRSTAFDLPGLEVTAYSGNRIAKFDLSLELQETADGGLTGQFTYATALFDRTTVERAAGHFQRLLHAVTTTPDNRLSTVDVLAPAERAALLGFNTPATLAGGCVHELVEAHAAATPAAIALWDNGSELTYAELNTRANQLAHHLRGLGAGPDVLVGVSLNRGTDLVVALLAVLKSGAAYLPLPPGLPAARLAHLLADSGTELVIAVEGEFPGVTVIDPATTGQPITNPVPLSGPDNLAYVIHTSGSTGRPKGVAVTHAAVTGLFSAADAPFRFTADDAWAQFHAYSFDVSVWEIWGALTHGARLVLVPGEAARSPEDLLDLLVAQRVTLLEQTPMAFRGLARLAAQGDPRIDRLSLRVITLGGEAVEPSELRRWTSGRSLDRTALYNTYGITETTVTTTYHRITEADLDGAGSPIGLPFPGIPLHLLDEQGELVPTGVTGEIAIGGCLARGYLGQPALTAERFVPDPHGAPGSRLYRSGDLARRRTDGCVDFLGRADTQVKIRGYRVELGEIQTRLAEHPDVREAVVVVRSEQLVAYVVPTDSFDAVPLRAHLAEALPDYMVPAAIVALATIPLSTSGKLDHRALPAPDRTAFAATGQVTARTDAEQVVVRALAEVLDRPADDIGVTDGFFDLGGDSIRAVAFTAALRTAGLDLAVRDVFTHRTLADLAHHATPLSAEAPAVAPFALVSTVDREALPEGVVDAYPLSQVQAGMLVEMLVADEGNVYHDVNSFRVPDDRPFSAPALRAAVDGVIARHEALRTSIALTGYQVPLQLVHATAEAELTIHGTALTPAFLEIERARLFDLETAPLLRFAVHVESATAWRLTLTQSHAITDGWSLSTLLVELLELYRAHRDGRPAPEHATPEIRYADFIAAELSAVDSAEHRAFWQRVVSEHSPFALPGGWSAPGAESLRATIDLSDLTEDLRTLAAGTSLKTVLLAAHLKVLSQLSTETTIHSGLVVHGRLSRSGGERVHGMHLNTVPFPAVHDARDFAELITRTHATEAQVWAHRRFPLPAIQRLAGTERLLSVLFDYQDFHQLDGELVDLDGSVGAGASEFTLKTIAGPDRIVLTGTLTPAAVDRLSALYRAVLTAMIIGGEATGSVLPAGEPAALVAAGRAASRVWPAASVIDMIEVQVALTPDAVAVRAGETTLTFTELDRQANQLAHQLKTLGAGPDTVIGVCLRRGALLLPALLGILKSGAAYLPIEADTPAERIGFQLADTAAPIVLTEAATTSAIPAGYLGRVLPLDQNDLSGHPESAPAQDIDPDTLAYVIYTSGSTGRPKGVMVTHLGLANYLHWTVESYGRHGEGGSPLFSAIAFDLPATNIYVPLVTGQPVHLVTAEPAELGQALAQAGPFGLLKLTPGHLDLLAHQLSEADNAALAARILVGGEALPAATAAYWLRVLGPDRLINEYGPTEATVANAGHPIASLPADLTQLGAPIANTSMHVLDPYQGLAALGVPGELAIGGDGLARGYLNRPALTAEKFVPDPLGVPGSRLYRTGDLARRAAEGPLDFLGRRDDQVKIRGYRIELGEIQARLTEHPGVREAVVLVRGEALVAYLTGTAIEVNEVRAHLSAVLPAYMIPAALLVLDRIPLTPNGKVDHRALPAPDRGALTSSAQVAPRTTEEIRLAEVWAEVLGVPRVGVTDSFFDLGGDSMRALRLVAAMRAAGFGYRVKDLYQWNSIAELCAHPVTESAPAEEFTPVRPFALLSATDRAALPDGVVDAYPLSQVQTGMLVETLSSVDGVAYHNLNSFRIPDEQPFSLPAFCQAVDLVTARHEVLRTSMHLDGFSRPLQLVHAQAQIPVLVHDLRALSHAEKMRAGREFAAAQRATGFELTSAPLVRIAVHLESDAAWRLTFTHSHAVTEGWSYHTLLVELLDAYHCLRDDLPLPHHTAPDARYADFIAAELSAVDSEDERAFWQGLVTTHAPLTLPASWGTGGPAERHVVRVPFADLEPGLRRVATTAGTSFKSVLLAAHLKVMSALTAEEAFHSGLVCHGRLDVPGGDRVLGMHLNSLPLPHTRGAGTWTELTRQAFAAEQAIWAHRRYPLPEIQRAAGADRLLTILFSYLDFHQVDGELVDLTADAGTDVGTDLTAAVNEFALNVIAVGGHLELASYTSALSRRNASRLAGMYRFVLEAMAADPRGDATGAPLPQEERARLLIRWNATDREFAGTHTVLDLIEAQAAETPDAIALRFGAHRLSYAELDRRANRIAHHLLSLGAGPDVLVGVCLDRGLDLVPALLGVWKAGAAYVPLDPSAPAERLALSLTDGGAAVLLTESRHLARSASFAGTRVLLDQTDLDHPDTAPERATDPAHLAYVIYTSGSTGRPKGVMISHQGLANHLRWAAEDLVRTEGGAPLFSSIAFDLPATNLFVPLMTGRTTHLLPEDLDLTELGELLLAGAPYSFIKLTPGHLDLLTHQLSEAQARALAGIVLVAGEALPPATANHWLALLGRDRLINEYGPTETSIGATTHPVGEPHDSTVPLGRPLPNTTAHVLDHTGDPVALGVPGELHLGGQGLARGYLGQPALTAEKFTPNPHGPAGTRLYRSGDAARRRPDGALEFLGRIDTQVKIRGYRIELGEIQARLTEHPAVSDAVVTTYESEHGRQLVAYLVAGSAPSLEDLRAHLAATLPDYMMPSAFTTIERIPLTANGKLDQRALPAPDRTALTTAAHVAPRTSTERTMAGIWATVLGQDADQVSAAHNFFDMGGDSIRAVRLIGAFRSAGFDLGIQDVFRFRTLAELADLVAEQEEPAPSTAAVEPFALLSTVDRAALPDGVVDAYPLSQVQTGMVVEMLASAAYHNVGSFRIPDEQPFSLPALRRALDLVTARHDVLRTSLHLDGFSQPVQLVHAHAEIPVSVHDLRGLDENAQRAAGAAFLASESATLFDLTAAPLLRIAVHLESDSAWRVTFTQSHAITDGWSLNTLLMELLSVYRGAEPLPTPGVRYADFVAAELESLADEADQSFWTGVVDSHEPASLPAHWGAAGPRTPHGVQVPLRELAPGLRALATLSGAALKSVLLAAHLNVLSLLTPSLSFHSGLVLHGRVEAEGSDQVLGMHLNTVPLPYHRSARTWAELVSQVLEAETAVWAHRRYPLPAIQRLAETDRLVSMLFEYLDFHQVDDSVDGAADPGLDTGAAAVNEFALNVIAGPDGFELSTFTDVLSPERLTALGTLYTAVLTAMAADPHGPAEVLPPGELDRQLVLAGGPEITWPQALTPDLFETQARLTPDAVAVVAGSGVLSYAELDRRANRIAHHLLSLGAGAETLVAVNLPRTLDLVPAMLAVWKAGAAYLPLDPGTPEARLRDIVEDAQASIVITESWLSELATYPDTAPARTQDPDALAYVLHTSGSTGRPKGVMISHGALRNLLGSFRDRLATGGVWLASTSISFDISGLELFLPLLTGGRVVLAADGQAKDPAALLALITEHGVDHVQATPSGWRLLLSAEADLPEVTALIGGEAVPVELAQRLRPLVRELVNVYGPTETTIWSTSYPIPADPAHMSLGAPLANTQAHVLDPIGTLLPTGLAGELCLGGAGLARGYLNRPALTAERFVPDPLGQPGSRLYRTGDLVRREADGTLEFLGRMDNQVKIRGYRVEPAEIEARLLAHPSVAEAVVIARSEQLVAYVTGTAETPAALRAHLAETLPEYMIPAAFVQLDRFPLNTSGKLDRRALPDPERGTGGVAPRNPVEARIAAIWAEVLGLPEAGVEDSFFDLGGDSMRAVRLSAALRAAGFPLGIREVFEHRTVAALATATGTATADLVEPFALASTVDRSALPADVVDAYPLSQVQTGMLVEMLSAEQPLYHNVNSFRLPDDQPFDEAAFLAAVAQLSERHEILRSSLHLDGYSQPLQLVHARAEIPVAVHDVRDHSPEQLRELGEAYFAAERTLLFELTTAPLLRIAVHLEPGAWRLTLTQPHAITDGWSLNTLVMELVTAYRGGTSAPIPVRYADFVAAELAAVDSVEDQEFWQSVVDEHGPLRLPEAWAGGAGVIARSDYADLDEPLRALATRARTSVKSVLLAAHLKVLSLLTHEESFHSGLVLHGRLEAEGGDRVLGMHLNTVPIPHRRTARTWLEMVEQTFATELGLWAHRRFPLPSIQRAAGTAGRLLQVMFDYQDFHQLDRGAVDAGATLSDGRTEFGLHVNVSGGTITLNAAGGVLGQAHADRLAGLYRAVLTAMAADPFGDPAAPVLPSSELALLAEPAPIEVPVPSRLHELFEQQVRTTPDATAVVFDEHRLSYAELNAEANKIAHHLRSLGAGPETLVGVCLDRGPELVPAILGVLKSGAAYVPLEPANPAERLSQILTGTGAPIVLTTSAHTSRLSTIHSGHLVSLDADLPEHPEADPAPLGSVDDLMYVIHTSGSTGRPKGVALTHANVTRLFTGTDGLFDFGPDEVWTMFHSYAFDVSVWEMWGALLRGGTLVVVPAELTRSPAAFLDLLVRHRVTVLCQTPSAFRTLVSLAGDEDPRVAELALRSVILAGERLDVAELAAWTDRFGLRPELVNMYGPTETVHATHHRLTASDLDRPAVSPIGRALPDLTLRLLDPHGNPVPLGVPGEVHLGGASVARGYLGRPELTAERFLPDNGGARHYRTGDLAVRRPDGIVEFLGRIDTQVKIRGYRVEPAEVQAVLAEHPAVREAVVLAQPGADGVLTLVAYVVPAQEIGLTELRAHLATRLPEYLVPAAFLTVDRIPLTTNGKLDHRALPALGRAAFAASAGVAPRTPAEARMAEVWTGVLSLDEVGVEDSFFDLGGDSMRAVRLAGALRAAGFALSIRDIFAHRTIAALCALTPTTSAERAPVEPFALLSTVDRSDLPGDLVDAYPLSQVQAGMLAEQLSSGGEHAYHMVGSFRIPDEKPFHAEAFRTALDEVTARHEILRTSIRLTGEPLQLVHATASIPITVHDLRHLDAEAQQEAGREFLTTERATLFDLATAPLLRIAVHLESAEAWRLTCTQSHVITDGWSLNTLLMEVLDRYRAHRDGTPVPVHPVSSVRYADFVAAELSAVDSAEDREFWQQVVGTHTPFVPPNWGTPEARERHHLLVPFPDLAPQLRELAATAQAPLKSVLLAAHLTVLGALTPEPAFHSGLVLHGRLEAEGGDRVLGMHLNTVPFPHTRATGSWAELVRQVAATEAELWGHRRFPLPEIQRAAGGERLIQVMFDYQDFHQVDGSVDAAAGVGAGADEFALNVTATPAHLSIGTFTDVLARESTTRLIGLYRTVLTAMAADPHGDATVIPLTDDEHTAHLVNGIGTNQPAAPATVLDLINAAIAATPEAPAVISGEIVLTFRELDQQATNLAHHLRSLGAGPDVPVGLLLDRGPALVPALLGILRSGSAYLPLDPAAPAERRAFQLTDAAAPILVTDTDQPGFSGTVVDPASIPAHPAATPDIALDPANLAYVIYTSGSTGRPKGVQVQHDGLVNYLRWAADTYTARATGGAPLFSSLAFDLPITNVLLPLITGQPVHLVTADPAGLGQELAATGPFSFIKLTPAHLDLLTHQLPDTQIAELAGVFVVGGEALPPATAARWLDILGPDRLLNEFGPTEATIANVVHPITGTHEGTVPIGRPIPNTSAQVTAETGDLVPLGALGELHIGGVGVARGYLGRPALTAERFVPDPLGQPGSRRYRTGDLARRETAGVLDFLGRIDSQVKIRGYRVELGEVQSHLAELVREAFVLARDGALLAYVVADGETGDLRARLAESLPDYMIPAAIMRLDALLLTPNGKVDQRALPAPSQRITGRVAPRTPLEQRIAALWADVLGYAEVGVLDNFFALGGDSIRALRLSAALRDNGIDLGLREIYRQPTVAGLAELAAGAEQAEAWTAVAPFALISTEDRAALPADVVDAYPISQVQTGMLVEVLAGSGRNSYHNVGSFRVPDRAPFDAGRFQAAVDAVLARHDVLRTGFHLAGYSQPLQLVHARVEVPVTVHDLREQADQARAAEEFLAAENARPFELTSAPLLRIAVHLESDDAWRLTFTHCHAITDGWTLHTLVAELLDTYHQRPVAEAPEVRYADFVAAELVCLDRKEDQAFWQEITDTHAPLTLPTAWADQSGSHLDTYTAKVSFAELGTDLRELARTARTSLKSVLLAAHLHVLGTITPEPRFHSGLVLHGRVEAEGGDRVMGMHLNTLPLPHDRTARSWLDLVRQAHAAEAEIWGHRRYPMPAIQRAAEAERLITVLFDYLDFHLVDESTVDSAAGLGSGANDFALNVLATGTGLALVTSTDVLSRTAAGQLADRYRETLAAMAANPHGPVRTAADPAALAAGEGSTVDVPGSTLELFENQAVATPDALAVRTHQGTLTYRELDERANQVGHHLLALGVTAESMVGVALARGLDLLPALLGVWKAGAAYLPLDPSLPADRREHMIRDAGADIVLTTAGFPGLPTHRPRRHTDPDQLAYVIYTSGSTGRPKGVMATHRGLTNYLLWTVDAYASHGAGGSAVFSPISFDLGIPNLFTPLVSGQATHLLAPDLDTAELGTELAAGGPYAFVKLTPAHLDLLTHQLTPRQAHDLAGLVIAAGDEFPVSLVRRWRDLAGGGTALATEYGPTEITIGNSGQLVTDLPDADLLPLGDSIPNTAMHVFGPTGELAPTGVPGEVFISGTGLARGYLGQPALTAEKFLPNPCGAPGSRIYRTGDLGRRLPGGSLDFLGRADHQVKIRGHRVELGEIQSRLLQHPAINEAVVLARDTTLVAYLVGDPVPVEELRGWLAEVLPEYMIPAAFVPIDRIPLTRNGKLDRRALPAPDRTAYASVSSVAPRTPAEQRLAAIWSELLQVNEISAGDNFFALGGDSIRAARLLATAQQAGLPMAMWMIYQASDLAELAALAAPHTTAAEMPLTTDQLRQLAEGHQVRSTRLALSGRPDPELLARALTAVADHHEALRLRVTAAEVMFAETGDVPFRAIQVSPTEDRGTVVTEAVEADRQAVDAATGPVLRATLVHFGADHHDSGQVGSAQPELWLTTSTLALDPESLPVLLTDLNTAYRQLSESRAAALPPIPVPLHQWSTREAERAAAEDLADTAHHWLTRSPGIDLSLDGGEQHQVTVTLSPERTAALLATPQAEDLLLITVGRTLTRWAGGDRIDVEISTDPRSANPELKRTVGPLRTSHPVSLWLPDRDLPAVLRSARRQLAVLGDRGDYGLLRHHAPDPDLAADLADLPRPQVAFGADLSVVDSQPDPLVFHPATSDHTPEHLLDVQAWLHEGQLYLRWTSQDGVVRELAQAHLDLLAESLGEQAPGADRTLDALSTVVTQAMAEHAVPGAALALIRDGELAGVLAHGTLAADDRTPVTPDTLFAAGSLSKTATTVAVLRLAERGELDLDRELTRFPVTIRQLLAHTAGLAVPEDEEPLRLEHPPGEVFRVNSAHFVLLQQVLTEHTGLDFAELMRRELFEPLGMTASTFVNPDPAAVARAHDAEGKPLPGGYEVNPPAAAGGLWTTAADLARLMIAIRRSYLGHPEAVLRQDLARAMLTAQSGRPYGWSAILDDSGADLEFGHGGQATGYQAMAGLRVHAGLGAVLLTNASSGRELVTRVIAAVWPSQARLTTLFQRAVDDATTAREHGA